jgi:tetraacyldisaccharide 4'-kinase
MGNVLISLTSVVWSQVSAAARWGSHVGLLKTVKLNSRVISVGNIQVGGAGKTPLVAQISNEGIARGLKVCILLRGYKSEWENQGGILAPGGQKIHTRLCGDEAALLHDLSPRAYVGVGANRLQQYQAILNLAQTKMDLVILDDGFQNWQIQKDLEIVAVTSAKPSEILFRDQSKALKHAQLLVWTKGKERPVTFGRPLVCIKYRLPTSPGNDPIWLVTGIADGQFAYSLALQSGYNVIRYLSFGDHAPYDLATVRGLMKQAAAVRCKVALTGKDWVKWRDLGIPETDVIVLEPELVFEEGRDTWSRLLWSE